MKTVKYSSPFVVDMPLTELDLTNFINVGDEGMQYIGKIKT